MVQLRFCSISFALNWMASRAKTQNLKLLKFFFFSFFLMLFVFLFKLFSFLLQTKRFQIKQTMTNSKTTTNQTTTKKIYIEEHRMNDKEENSKNHPDFFCCSSVLLSLQIFLFARLLFPSFFRQLNGTKK